MTGVEGKGRCRFSNPLPSALCLLRDALAEASSIAITIPPHLSALNGDQASNHFPFQ